MEQAAINKDMVITFIKWQEMSLRVKRSNLTQGVIPSEAKNLLRDCHRLRLRNDLSGRIAMHPLGARNDSEL